MRLRWQAMWVAFWALLAPLVLSPLRAETFYVERHGGVPLAVTVAGPQGGPEILLLHGIGMGAESFSPQLESELSEHYRMVAFDLRGHGLSGKPWEAQSYTSKDAWAGDVARVIAATGLRRPVIMAWSYGTLVAADYIMAAGLEGISGLVLVSSLGGLDPPAPRAEAPDPEILAQLERSRKLLMSPRLGDQAEAYELLAPMLFEVTDEGPSEEWQQRTKMLAGLVPPYAQVQLRAHPADNAGLLPYMARLPLLVVNGAKDLALSAADLTAFRQAFNHAEIPTFADAGHSPLAEQPTAFNAVLADFVSSHWEPVK